MKRIDARRAKDVGPVEAAIFVTWAGPLRVGLLLPPVVGLAVEPEIVDAAPPEPAPPEPVLPALALPAPPAPAPDTLELAAPAPPEVGVGDAPPVFDAAAADSVLGVGDGAGAVFVFADC